MERDSRDLLCRIGGAEQWSLGVVGGGGGGEEEEEVVELSLGLSLGGRFGVDPKGSKLERSSSIASVLPAAMGTEEVVAPAQVLARTSSLPTGRQEVRRTMLERGSSVGAAAAAAGGPREKPELDVMGSRHENGVGVSVAPELQPVSGSSPSGSSDGEGPKVEVNIMDALMRTSSLPAGIEDEWRKRKLQSLKRLEVKRKRLERRTSLTSSAARESPWQRIDEVNAARVENVDSCSDTLGNKHTRGSVDVNHVDGLLPSSETLFRSRGRTFLGIRDTQSQHIQGRVDSSAPSAHVNEHNLSAVQSIVGHTKDAMLATSSALGARMAANCDRGEQNHQRRVAGRAKSMGDVKKMMMQEMPCVSTKGLGPNGKRVEGFLYKYRKGEEVRIVCVCHGRFLTPAEFVKHAGGEDVTNPLRHIVINPVPSSFL